LVLCLPHPRLNRDLPETVDDVAYTVTLSVAAAAAVAREGMVAAPGSRRTASHRLSVRDAAGNTHDLNPSLAGSTVTMKSTGTISPPL